MPSIEEMLSESYVLPEGWSRRRFGEVARFAVGQVSPMLPQYWDLLHIGPENIESDTGRLVSLERISDLNLISGKYEFDANAIVYSKIRPNLNKVCLPGFAGLCSADAYPIWVEPNLVDSKFLVTFMRSELFRRQAVAVSMRTGMPKIRFIRRKRAPRLKRADMLIPIGVA